MRRADVMADQWKFIPPVRAQKTVLAGAAYALHIDAKLVAQYLGDFGEARGVKRTEGIVTDVVARPDGLVEKVIMKDGRQVEGDLFIDCPGFRALLIGKALNEEFLGWSTC